MPKRKTPSENDRPPGAQPTRKNDTEDRRIREEAQEEAGSDAPMDPEDEQFIESK